ncbi:MAG: hypothetical protein JSU00_17155 [Acidobacteria bacterium]|nr:hypothetical protein [Acidobacteriota bacterium]
MRQNHFSVLIAQAFLLTGCGVLPAAALDARGADLLAQSVRLMDGRYDDRAALIRSLSGNGPSPHLVRESALYAVGLLMRDHTGDRDRAARILDAVLRQQIYEPEERWHGTFYKFAEDRHPPRTARLWTDYDPNWREFIGTTFQVILTRFRDRIPKELAARMEKSIVLALEGEIHEARLKPSYTNIALMYGAIADYAGNRLNRPDLARRAAAWTESVYREFKEHGAFPEFNSPTYYGPDLFGLAMWRAHGSTPRMRAIGAEMEATLWRSIAAFYHAGLRNMSGPYDRSYGMDMRRYVSVTGLLLRTVLDAEQAPFPPFEIGVDHANDLPYLPLTLAEPTQIPAGAMESFRSFQGERLVRQAITSTRVATAWIGADYMYGGESTSMTRDALEPDGQFHAATAHWRLPDGDVGWIRLLRAPRLDATASREGLSISCTGDMTFRIHAPGAAASAIQRNHWTLPGLFVQVYTDATGAETSAGDDHVDIVYHDMTRLTLRFATAK